MSWILIKVFFGSSYLGFDIMNDINAKLGPPLMLVFVTMTNILLITSLISILSNTFSKVISHAREEYLFVYSVYVLEVSTTPLLRGAAKIIHRHRQEPALLTFTHP
jgi:hypothetical protein